MDKMTVNVDEVSKMLGLGKSFVYKLIEEGTLPSFRLGRRIIIPLQPIQEMLAKVSEKKEG